MAQAGPSFESSVIPRYSLTMKSEEVLVQAASMGDLSKVKELLAEGTSIRSVYPLVRVIDEEVLNLIFSNSAALFAAYLKGNFRIALVLLDHMAANGAGRKMNPFYWPILLEMMNREIKAHNPRMLDEEGYPLAVPISNYPRHQGYQTDWLANDLQVFKYLVRNYFVNVDCMFQDGYTPLVTACLAGKISAVRYLASIGADLSKSSRRGLTPLVAAVHRGHGEIVDFLLEKGAATCAIHPEEYGGGLISPCLFYAISSDQCHLVARLVQYGAVPCPMAERILQVWGVLEEAEMGRFKGKISPYQLALLRRRPLMASWFIGAGFLTSHDLATILRDDTEDGRLEGEKSGEGESGAVGGRVEGGKRGEAGGRAEGGATGGGRAEGGARGGRRAEGGKGGNATARPSHNHPLFMSHPLPLNSISLIQVSDMIGFTRDRIEKIYNLTVLPMCIRQKLMFKVYDGPPIDLSPLTRQSLFSLQSLSLHLR